MKSYALAIVMVVVVAAGYSQRSEAAPCVASSLATYTAAGFSCTIDSKTFDNFLYGTSQSGGTALPGAASVSVTPFLVDALHEQLVFNAAWLIDPGQTGDVSLIFRVTSSGLLIDDLDVILTGTNFGGTGSVIDTTQVCSPGFPGCLIPSTDITLGAPTHHFLFPPVSSITINEDTVLIGGTLGADYSILTKTVSQVVVPEPTSLVLLGVGLFGLAVLRRRKTLR